MFKLLIIAVVSAIFTASVLSLPGWASEWKNEFQSRIFNGFPSERGQFPSQVLLKATRSNGMAICGGVLINEQWVLTAAHCGVGGISFELHLGAQNFHNIHEIGRIIDVTTRVIIHPNYNRFTFENDVALIQLSKAVTFSDTINPALLPSIACRNESFVNRTVIASGWGLRHPNDAELPAEMHWAPLYIITETLCKRLLGSSIVHPSTICARGTNSESVCNGDSGGPLFLTSDNRTIIGITSFGHRVGCHFGLPQGFGRVTRHLDWIARHTGTVNNNASQCN